MENKLLSLLPYLSNPFHTHHSTPKPLPPSSPRVKIVCALRGATPIVANVCGTIEPAKWEGLSDRRVFNGSQAIGSTVFTYSVDVMMLSSVYATT